MLVLGIESSCDETAAAVVRDGREIVSSVIASQIEMHKPWGGVVPELASREHLEKIDGIVSQAMAEAGLGFDAIDAVAVTQGPGLIGSLLVGVLLAAFGMTPWQYLTRVRLEAARRSLCVGQRDASVTEIALDAGFSHLGEFAAQYRQRYGERPVDTARRARSSR